MRPNQFHFKSFTSFLLAWTFVVLVLSGSILFVSPPGRVANWTNWTLLGGTKEGWQAIHVLMAVMFVTGGIFHILKFNWKILFHYVTARRSGLRHRREMVASLLVFGTVLAGTLAGFAPFTSVMEAGESVKNSWESEDSRAPMPHTELLSLREVLKLMQVEPAAALDSLQKAGIEAGSLEQTLGELGNQSGRSPLDIYRLLTAQPGAVVGQPRLGGVGRKTVRELAQEMGMEVEELLRILREKGVEATPNERIRDVAGRLAVDPHQFVDMISAS